MLLVGSARSRNCEGVSRREILRVGGLSMLGLALPDLWCRAAGPTSAQRDMSCIFLWLDGGPSHFETFDPKPATPDNVRGPYGIVQTRVPGVHFCELLPQLAERLDRFAVIRSMTHGDGGHAPNIMMTGYSGKTTSHGAVVTKLLGDAGDVPPYIHLGKRLNVGGGQLGAVYNPIEVPDPTGGKLALPGFELNANVPAERFNQRSELLGTIDKLRGGIHQSRDVEKMDAYYQRAIGMLTSAKVREAFDLAKEKDELRARYGANFFGQSCLMARRLVEAGTRFVQIKWYDGPAWDAWDVHGADLAGMERMEKMLCPRLDQGLSALLDDLQQRGLFDSTLVVAVGEFGRTPRINNSGARDHWPQCFSAFFAGAGIPGGTVVGASDREGAYPANTPVSPLEFAATIYKKMGIDTNTDPRIRPFIGTASPVNALL
jgi:hypothetical protein